MVYGLTGNSMFQIDGRIPKKCKVIESKEKVYKSIHDLDAIATSNNGWIVTGAKDGKIRLHEQFACLVRVGTVPVEVATGRFVAAVA